MTEELVPVCPQDEVSEGVLKSIDIEGIPLMVTLHEGKYIVSSRICTHKTYDLTKGYYEDGYVTCMLHTSIFDLSDSGLPNNQPATEPLQLYETQVVDGMIYIKI